MPLRKPSSNGPQISQVTPAAAIAGGELQIRGKGFAKSDRPHVTIGDVAAPVVIGSDSLVIARVPEGATAGELVIESGKQSSESWACDIGVLMAESLHPVANPAVDSFGNIYTTFSGSRGQKTPVAVYRIDLNFNMKPFINELMNATVAGLRSRRAALHFQPLRRHRVPSRRPTATCRSTWRAWASRRASLSTAKTTCTSATAAARSSRSAPTARSSCSPRSSLPSPPIIWRSAPMGIFTSPGRPRRASIASTAFRTKARWRFSIAAWGVRRAWRSTRRAGSMWRPRLRAARAWCASPRTSAPTCSFPDRASWAWHSRLRAPWSWPPPMPSIAWTSASRAGFAMTS